MTTALDLTKEFLDKLSIKYRIEQYDFDPGLTYLAIHRDDNPETVKGYNDDTICFVFKDHDGSLAFLAPPEY